MSTNPRKEEEFLQLVKMLREAQKNLHQHRTTHYLELTKALEKKVDAHIEMAEKKQISLFQ